MFDVMKRHEIQVLRRAGHSQLEVAELAGVSERIDPSCRGRAGGDEHGR